MIRSPREDPAPLWERFLRGEKGAREKLIERYRHLVDISALKMVVGGAWDVDLEDLKGEGYIGLIRAIDSFDPARGVQFASYAIALIRGNILEWLRNKDWVPRLTKARLKALDRAQQALLHRLGRAATEEELLSELGWTPEAFDTVCKERQRLFVLSLDTFQAPEDRDSEHLLLKDLYQEEREVFETVADILGWEALHREITRLPEREARVVWEYYWGEKTFREIGRVLEISESRAYQLHGQALQRLRLFLASRPLD